MEDETVRSSEDEGPEDISHSHSKDAAKEREKLEKEAKKQHENTKKDVRRKRQKRFTEQKQAKRERLSLERLPDEIIDILSSVDKNKNDAKIKATSDVKDINSTAKGRKKMKVSKKKYGDKLKVKVDDTKELRKISNLPKAYVLNKNYRASSESKVEKGRKFLKEQLYGERIKRVGSDSIRNSYAMRTARPKAKF